MALGLIFILLYFSLGSLRDVLMVATGIPLGAVGGVALLALRGMPLTVSAAIGFVALSGVAILNGLVLVTFIKQRQAAGVPFDTSVRGLPGPTAPRPHDGRRAAVGFIPMAVNTGVRKSAPLATVVIGGIVSNTLLTLLVLRRHRQLSSTARDGGGGRRPATSQPPARRLRALSCARRSTGPSRRPAWEPASTRSRGRLLRA